MSERAEEIIGMGENGTPRKVAHKTGSPYEMCTKEVLYHGFLCFAAIVVIVTQGTVLNFYIIAFYRGYRNHVASYFLFLGDLFVVCIFAISFTTAYRFIHLRRKLELKTNLSERQIQQKVQRSIYKYVMWLTPNRCGTLPFAFISWFVYSVYLVSKISIILSTEIPSFVSEPVYQDVYDPISGLGSNLLKVTTGLAALVFIIMLQAHHNHNPDSPHSGYITGVCHNIAIEVFDSVTLFSLLVIQDKHTENVKHLRTVIIVLSSINLVLPTLTLYSLSMSDFGRHLETVIPVKVIYQLLHLLVINIPFLGVRIYLWGAFNYELSLFVVKNLCYIFMLSHSLYPGISWILKHRHDSRPNSSASSGGETMATHLHDDRSDMHDSINRSGSSRVQGIPRRHLRRPPSLQSGTSERHASQDIELLPMNKNRGKTPSSGHGTPTSPKILE